MHTFVKLKKISLREFKSKHSLFWQIIARLPNQNVSKNLMETKISNYNILRMKSLKSYNYETFN